MEESWGGTPLLARWTSNWDCKTETNWWYTIKDSNYDISSLKSKRRYEINKGKKNFTVERIDPLAYIDEIVAITKRAVMGYPEKYRPIINEVKLEEDIRKSWVNATCFIAKDQKGIACGYARTSEFDNYISFDLLKADPDFEKSGVNFAIVDGILTYYDGRLNPNFYLSDGERAVNHETHFQDFLIKYFGFRKEYCKLNISYPNKVKLMVGMLYPIRKVLYRIDNNPAIHKVCSVLKMESLRRESL